MIRFTWHKALEAASFSEATLLRRCAVVLVIGGGSALVSLWLQARGRAIGGFVCTWSLLGLFLIIGWGFLVDRARRR
jgi:hypothetical protein